MKKKKFRIPRKLKKKIPKGVYCYTPTSGWKQFKDGHYGYSIKSCPFYKSGEDIFGTCKLLKCEVEDQCKSCSIKLGYTRLKL